MVVYGTEGNLRKPMSYSRVRVAFILDVIDALAVILDIMDVSAMSIQKTCRIRQLTTSPFPHVPLSIAN